MNTQPPSLRVACSRHFGGREHVRVFDFASLFPPLPLGEGRGEGRHWMPSTQQLPTLSRQPEAHNSRRGTSSPGGQP